MKRLTIAFTGHRPDKLGCGYEPVGWRPWAEALADIMVERMDKDVHYRWITGGALGLDLLAARAGLHLIDRGYSVWPVLAIPFKGHDGRWSADCRAAYTWLESVMGEKHWVSQVEDGIPVPAMLDIRNRWMVDRVAEADAGYVVAAWDGSEKGGTANCVRYANRKGVEVVNVWKELQVRMTTSPVT